MLVDWFGARLVVEREGRQSRRVRTAGKWVMALPV